MSNNIAGRRKSRSGILRRPSLGPLSLITDDPEKAVPKTLKKKSRIPSLPSSASPSSEKHFIAVTEDRAPLSADLVHPRQQLLRKGRPSSIFGSLKSFRTIDDDTPPATASSSKAPSVNWKDFGSHTDSHDIGKNRNVLHHGEAQTNSGMFWKRREYLVLTETHLVRLRNQGRASEMFSSIGPSAGRMSVVRHTSSPSTGSRQETSSGVSDTSGEKAAGIALEHIVAVHVSDEPRQLPALDVTYLDCEAGQGTTLILTFTDLDDAEVWLRAIRYAANKARVLDTDPIPPRLSEYAARVVEREQDYDISNYKIYKVVKCASSGRVGSRSSSDDFSKISPIVCFVVIGVRKIHLIPLPKNTSRVSSPMLTELNDGGSFGIVSMTSVSVNTDDDTFTLAFRLPFQRPQVLQLASLASCEIALRIRRAENALRPGWTQRPYAFELPPKIDDDYLPDPSVHEDELDRFDRTLVAYCVAYGINPSAIRYAVSLEAEDGPRFELLDPAHNNCRGYTALELLAILRSLRYDEGFGSISFANVSLDLLNGVYDPHGSEHACNQTIHGSHMKLHYEDQQDAPVLVQEIRALAIGSRRLRRLDFSYSISAIPLRTGSELTKRRTSCGIVEALFPLCKLQATNVDWIALNGIELQETDLDYLVSIAADRSAHFRAIEASHCGLTDRGMALLLDVFRAHENTLEALDLSNNTLRLVPSTLSSQLSTFGYIRRLDLSNLAVTSSADPILPLEIISEWRLEDLRLRGLPLNIESVTALCGYLANRRSEVLKELILANCSLSGGDIARMMQSMTQEPGTARLLHFDISENALGDKHDHLVSAIARGLAPTHLSARSIEFDDEDVFRELLLAFATNNSIRYLDLAKTSLPGEASEDTCKALEKLLSDNTTLEDFDISGEDSRLEVSKLGAGINQALKGLHRNRTLQILRVQYQKLGLEGASILADVLKENQTLRQLHCDCNNISLSGFTDLVNTLAFNSTLLYLPSLEEGRDAALRHTTEQIRLARNKNEGSAMSSATSKVSSMKRTLASFGSNTATASFKGPSKTAAVPEWTEQDVQAALRLVHEGWEGQVKRLEVFLDRNWKMYNGMALDVDEAAAGSTSPQRPGTAGSITKIMERATIDTTPTMEKQTQLGDDIDDAPLDGETDKKRMSSPRQSLGDLPVDNHEFMDEKVFGLAGQPNGQAMAGTFSPPQGRGSIITRRAVSAARPEEMSEKQNF
ncbi:MAG: hypothetical protein M1828_006396 [Chrysothrix sp. TS-e1954]|nr:MAG: hypothetical protein M1828_006396 [Chrysothrix sp. TS-e1954]